MDRVSTKHTIPTTREERDKIRAIYGYGKQTFNPSSLAGFCLRMIDQLNALEDDTNERE